MIVLLIHPLVDALLMTFMISLLSHLCSRHAQTAVGWIVSRQRLRGLMSIRPDMEI